jgi:hypothetical protein
MGKRRIENVEEFYGGSMERMPVSREELACYLKAFLGLKVSDKRMCSGHSSPMDYMCHSLLGGGGDCVVWANRGGGKTMLGAAATLIDCACRLMC